jgi:type IV pilus assembly protein PilW
MSRDFNNRQFGLSMIELLVALALSSFLILGVTQIYIDNKRTYLYQQGQSETQENARFVAMTFEQQLMKTGYRRRPDESPELAFPARSYTVALSGAPRKCEFSAGDAIKRIDKDSFCIRYQPRNQLERDCNGQSLRTTAGLTTPYTSTEQTIVEIFSVADGGLRCGVPADTATAVTATNNALIDSGISGLHIQYGVSDKGNKTIEKYVDAETEISGNVVRGLRYTLLLTTTSNNLRQGMATDAYCQWEVIQSPDKPCSEPTDDRLYQLATGSVAIRNLMP